MRFKRLILGLAAGFISLSCQKEEEIILPDYDKNWLVVEEDPNDPTSGARYQFYKQTNIPIYVNDTIGTQLREDVFGNSFTYYEVLSLNYSLSTPEVGAPPMVMNIRYMEPQYLTTGIEFLKTEIIPALSSKIHVPSILLVESFFSNAFGTQAYKGFNTILIGDVSKISTMSTSEKAKYKGAILRSMYTNAVLNDKYKETLEKFYAISRKFVPTRDAYNIYIPQLPTFVTGLPAGSTISPQAIGFISGDGRSTFYTPMSTWMDVSIYLDAFFTYSEQEFTSLYGTYPPIMQKYDFIKQIISDLRSN